MSAINVSIEADEVVFRKDGAVAGVYRLNDPFKPHFHPLQTPAGRVVTVCSPGDHRHHKGLMYGLRAADLNFWEEDPGSADCGVQRVLSTDSHRDEGGEGIVQKLRWEREDGDLATYEETRSITCRPTESGDGFAWTWRSQRTSLRDHQLIMSQWSVEKADGTKVNYHGLGIRLPWPWSVPSCRKLWIDGNEEDNFVEGSGGMPSRVVAEGLLDGEWKAPKVRLEMAQPSDQACGLFALGEPFPYLSLGPSNLAPLDVAAGQTFDELFTVTVSDLDQES